MKERLSTGLQDHGVAPPAVESILNSLASFALYGFPESHAISFAKIAYSSAWLKVHRPAAFHAALLNNQPMGFYSPASLVQDARRHGVRTLPVCLVTSGKFCRVESDDTVRLGFIAVRGLRAAALDRMLAARAQLPFVSLADFLRRTNFTAAERRLLAKSGALNALAQHRRAALWRVEEAHTGDELFRLVAVAEPEVVLSPLERMTHLERLQADYETLHLTTGGHPMRLLRDRLPGVRPAAELKHARAGELVQVGGAVITRQRPGTAKGFCFITLEDETGHANAIVRPALFELSRLVINLEPALLITGRLQNEQGVIHIMAETITGLPDLGLPAGSSHNYH
jgi:error-prone DNA polymerase